MRSFIALILVFFNLPLAKAQINLVPNPSFEDTLICPTTLDQIDATLGWSSYSNSPDYFNGCANSSLNVPNTSFGFQYAHSGNAFAGIITYVRQNDPSGPNYRENVEIQLISPLQVGTKYYISFYCVRAEKNTGFASNNIGLRLFTSSYSKINPSPIDNLAHLKVDSILTDSIIWQKFSASIIADSSYNYISIGNFFNDLNTDTLIMDSTYYYAYYFIDDICVSLDSVYNETWTSINEINFNDIQIWPNPTNKDLNVKSIIPIDSYEIIDINGRIVHKNNPNKSQIKIEFDDISTGLYIIKFNQKGKISVHKFILF